MPGPHTYTSGPVSVSAVEPRASDTWLIALQGAIDADAVTRLQCLLGDALTGYDRIVIDLRDVSVLATPTLARLCCALRHAHRPGATFVIAGAPPAVEHVLRTCEVPGVELGTSP